jgi:hypothetical protein
MMAFQKKSSSRDTPAVDEIFEVSPASRLPSESWRRTPEGLRDADPFEWAMATIKEKTGHLES